MVGRDFVSKLKRCALQLVDACRCARVQISYGDSLHKRTSAGELSCSWMAEMVQRNFWAVQSGRRCGRSRGTRSRDCFSVCSCASSGSCGFFGSRNNTPLTAVRGAVRGCLVQAAASDALHSQTESSACGICDIQQVSACCYCRSVGAIDLHREIFARYFKRRWGGCWHVCAPAWFRFRSRCGRRCRCFCGSRSSCNDAVPRAYSDRSIGGCVGSERP